jgi:hypothetical protein
MLSLDTVCYVVLIQNHFNHVGKIAGIDSAGSALVSTEIDSTKSSTGLMGLVESTGHGNPVG